MVLMKRIRMPLILVMTMMLLTGCWNRVEVNDIAIVTAIGLDLTEDERVRLSLQVANPTKLGPTGGSAGGSNGKSTFVISETGVTVSEAYRQLQGKLPRRIFFSQSRVLLIGEDLAKKGVSSIIDFHTRYHEPRINSFIMFTKGEASELLNSMPNLESVSAEETKELAKLNVGVTIYIMDFLNMLLTDGIEPFGPQFTSTSLEVNNKNKSKEAQATRGTAVFKKDKLVGWMNEVETRGILWLRNEMETGVITINIPEEKGGGNVSFDIIRTETQSVPKLKHGELKFTVIVTAEVSVMENDSNIKLEDPKIIEGLQKNIENEIKDRIQLVIEKTQQEYQSDIFGFGQEVYKKYPKEWNKYYKKNWEQEFSQLEVTIKPNVFVRRIGLVK
jgi:spore germination protein KC